MANRHNQKSTMGTRYQQSTRNVEMYCQGWDIVCVYVLHWGVNTLMEIDEGEVKRL
jgi:hypothetical protein